MKIVGIRPARFLNMTGQFLCVLMLLEMGGLAQAFEVIITQPPPPELMFQGATILSGPIGFCTDEHCTLLEPAKYGFVYGGDPITLLPAPPRSGSVLLDVSSTIGPTELDQLFLPYPIGAEHNGTLTARLTVERPLGFAEDIRFAVATKDLGGDLFADMLPGTFSFEAIHERHYFAVVYGAGFGEPISYRLRVIEGSLVPEPSSIVLLGLGFGGLALGAAWIRSTPRKRRPGPVRGDLAR